MGWRKLGLVYDAATHRNDWRHQAALTPTPILHRDGHLRVYAGFRDETGVSRIGFVDLDVDDPTRVKRVSEQPALNIGRDGCFDDNGVILGDVVKVGRRLALLYVGFQLVRKAKFLALTGLAWSDDDGETFQRDGEAPVLGRGPSQTMIAAVHTVLPTEDGWHIWYARGDEWQVIAGKPYPKYEICYQRTKSLESIPRQGTLCLPPTPPEYRIGRPRVLRVADGFELYCTYGTTDGRYLPAFARSPNGTSWTRADEDLGLGPGPDEWDNKQLCYMAPIEVNGRRFAFYNGNDMGGSGFGVAIEAR